MKPVIAASCNTPVPLKEVSRPLIRKTALESLLARWQFNPLDTECVLDLAPSFEIDGETCFDLTAVEKLLARAYWVGTDASRHLDAAA